MASYVLAQLLSLTDASSSSSSSSPSPVAAAAAAPTRIVVLISGSGTNLQALISAQPLLSSTIVYVLSNRASAYGLTRARSAGIATGYHNLQRYRGDRAAYDVDLAKLVLEQRPDVVVCAGWMHILSQAALEPLEAAGVDIINLHPALPGMFDGKDAIGRAWRAFQEGEVRETGVMVHHVIGAVDRGEPVLVRKVEMRTGESLDELEARIHEVEHEAIVEGTRIVVEQRADKSKRNL